LNRGENIAEKYVALVTTGQKKNREIYTEV
jgi:hypothetical protein